MTLSDEMLVEQRARRAVLGTAGVRRVVLPVGAVVLLLAVWQAAVSVFGISALVLPAPESVLRQVANLPVQGGFWRHVSVSLFEFGSGFVLGTVLGVLVGIAMSEVVSVRMTLNPVVQGLRFIVPFAWISLVVLWFGTSLWGKVLLVAYAVFFVMIISTLGALRLVDPTLSRAATVLGMSRWRRALLVHLRAAAPTIASGARAAAAIGWIAVIAAEYVGSNAGLGFLVISAASSVETAVVIAGMIYIGLIGAGISVGIDWLSRRRLSYV